MSIAKFLIRLSELFPLIVPLQWHRDAGRAISIPFTALATDIDSVVIPVTRPVLPWLCSSSWSIPAR